VEYIQDFGPMARFWTYIFKQLNKTLKLQKYNNHGRGVIETTWFNTFLHAQLITRKVSHLLYSIKECFLHIQQVN